MIKRTVFVILIALTCVGCDQYTKSLAREDLEPGQPVLYFGGLLRLQYVENAGAMLSVGAEFSESVRFWLFTVAVGLFLLGILLFVCIHNTLPAGDRFAAALIAGGGFGNLIDRLLYGGTVIDFMNIGVGPIRTAVFNVADVALITGAALLVIRYLHRVKT